MHDAAYSAPLRTIAGWPIGRVILTIVGLAAMLWGIWATHTLIELQHRRIVSVSLSRLVEDFVAAEARNSGSPEQSAKRTGAYLSAVNNAVVGMARDGTIVLVSEATLGRSVEDRTSELRARVTQVMEAERDPR